MTRNAIRFGGEDTAINPLIVTHTVVFKRLEVVDDLHDEDMTSFPHPVGQDDQQHKQDQQQPAAHANHNPLNRVVFHRHCKETNDTAYNFVTLSRDIITLPRWIQNSWTYTQESL